MNIDINPLATDLKPAIADSVRERKADRVGVALEAGEYRLVATRPIAAGERLFRMEGEITAQPSRYSVQVGESLHIAPGVSPTTEKRLDRYFWRFMNHSCDPNTVVREREVFAWRDIHPGEAVTFDYNTTEWEMAEPFICHCGNVGCLKEIRGFKHLTAALRERLLVVAPHLRRSAAMESITIP